MTLRGRARDAVTGGVAGPPEVIDEAALKAVLTADRRVLELTTTPHRPEVDALVGMHAGERLRASLASLVPTDAAAGTCLHLLLDDLVGASLVSAFALKRWALAISSERPVDLPPSPPPMTEGVCFGFAPGSAALVEQFERVWFDRAAEVPDVVNPDDPYGWHHHTPLEGVAMRRSRRLDAWFDGDVVRIDAFFQDRCRDPDGRQVGVHEYLVTATVDPRGGLVTTLTPDARILPFVECPGAVDMAGAVVGEPYADFRWVVPSSLGATQGCTHLNDVLRSFADLPGLIGRLDQSCHVL